ncbi:MAG: cupin domain-containing protein [Tissierellia bacterium]|nr:cupin domain-containing protein [Tissierellia bacterium]
MNLYDEIEVLAGEERVSKLFENEKILIEKINSNCAPSGPYNQEQDEWIVLIRGAAVIELEGEKIALEKGDSFFIAKNRAHKVLKTTDDALWLTVFIK